MLQYVQDECNYGVGIITMGAMKQGTECKGKHNANLLCKFYYDQPITERFMPNDLTNVELAKRL